MKRAKFGQCSVNIRFISHYVLLGSLYSQKVEYSRDLLEIYHLNHKNLCCGHIVHPLAQVYSSETKENEAHRYLPYTTARCPASL